MEFQDVVRRRSMVREFTDEPVSHETVQRIMDNAVRGPSAGYAQGQAFLVLEGEDARSFVTEFGSWVSESVRTAQVVVVPFAVKATYLERYSRQDKAGTPWVAVLVCSVLYSLFSLTDFAWLVVITVVLYAVTVILEFAALIVLRVRLPNMKRPFRVPGGMAGAVVITVLPCAILALAIYSHYTFEGAQALYLSAIGLATGPLLYPLLKRFVKKDRPDVAVPVEFEASP